MGLVISKQKTYKSTRDYCIRISRQLYFADRPESASGQELQTRNVPGDSGRTQAYERSRPLWKSSQDETF